MRMPREIVAAALWVAAVACLSFGTIDTSREAHTSPFLAWGVFLSTVAVVPTVWHLLCRVIEEREVDVERIAEAVDALHQARSDVARLPEHH